MIFNLFKRHSDVENVAVLFRIESKRNSYCARISILRISINSLHYTFALVWIRYREFQRVQLALNSTNDIQLVIRFSMTSQMTSRMSSKHNILHKIHTFKSPQHRIKRDSHFKMNVKATTARDSIFCYSFFSDDKKVALTSFQDISARLKWVSCHYCHHYHHHLHHHFHPPYLLITIFSV